MNEAERLNNIASQLYLDGKRQVAFSLIAKALRLDPKNVGIIVNYACILTNFGRYNEAAKIFHEITQEYPSNILAWHGYGVLNLVSGHPEYAETCFDQCSKLYPKNLSHTFDKACAVIQSGEWERGLQLYEIRRKWKPERVFSDMMGWCGDPAQNVYVWAEQGIGDTIQYARYLPWMVGHCNKVTFAVPPYLLGLFRDFKICRVVSSEGAMVEADYQVPLMSLHRFYGTHRIPEPWEFNSCPSLPKTEKKKIAICWSCNSSSANFRERSIPFRDFLKLTELDYEFHSVQVGRAAQDIMLESANNLVTDHSAEIAENWAATRDILSSCDYVVSTDTSVAHLAASMGVPTLMFLARRDWWRWGNEGHSTPWYPSMTIIRQETPYKWEKEIDQAYAILDRAARERTDNRAA